MFPPQSSRRLLRQRQAVQGRQMGIDPEEPGLFRERFQGARRSQFLSVGGRGGEALGGELQSLVSDRSVRPRNWNAKIRDLRASLERDSQRSYILGRR